MFPGEDFAGAGNHAFDPLGTPLVTPDDSSYELDIESPPPLVVDPLEQAVDIEELKVSPTES